MIEIEPPGVWEGVTSDPLLLGIVCLLGVAIVILGLVLVRKGWGAWQEHKAQSLRARGRQTSSNIGGVPVATSKLTADEARRRAKQSLAVPVSQELEIESLTARVLSLEEKVEQLASYTQRFDEWAAQATARSGPPVAPTAVTGTPALEHAKAPTLEAGLGAAFVSWCRSAGGNVGQRDRFADQLNSLFPQVKVGAVYRDVDSARLPVTFVTSATGASAESWIVEGSGRAWLLPCPSGPLGFRDLAPGVFDVVVAPKNLASCTPAPLRRTEEGFVAERPGALA